MQQTFIFLENARLRQPSYIYSAGHSICRTPIHVGDRTVDLTKDLDCSINDVGQIVALTFDAHAEIIYYSDNATKEIKRYRKVTTDEVSQTIAVQTGEISGMFLNIQLIIVYFLHDYSGISRNFHVKNAL